MKLQNPITLDVAIYWRVGGEELSTREIKTLEIIFCLERNLEEQQWM